MRLFKLPVIYHKHLLHETLLNQYQPHCFRHNISRQQPWSSLNYVKTLPHLMQ